MPDNMAARKLLSICRVRCEQQEQKTAYLKVSDQVKAKYPAFSTTFNERSQAVISENLVAVRRF